jgi:hypothetical protein
MKGLYQKTFDDGLKIAAASRTWLWMQKQGAFPCLTVFDTTPT